MALIPAPDDLGRAGRALWLEMTGAYVYDPGELALLHAFCAQADRIATARRAIRSRGFIVGTKNGPRANPALGAERAAINLMASLHKQLTPTAAKQAWPPRRRGGMSR